MDAAILHSIQVLSSMPVICIEMLPSAVALLNLQVKQGCVEMNDISVDL